MILFPVKYTGPRMHSIGTPLAATLFGTMVEDVGQHPLALAEQGLRRAN